MYQSINHNNSCINIAATFLFRPYHNNTPTTTCTVVQNKYGNSRLPKSCDLGYPFGQSAYKQISTGKSFWINSTMELQNVFHRIIIFCFSFSFLLFNTRLIHLEPGLGFEELILAFLGIGSSESTIHQHVAFSFTVLQELEELRGFRVD